MYKTINRFSEEKRITKQNDFAVFLAGLGIIGFAFIHFWFI